MVEPDRRVLGDRYALEELIAAGGMGQVWRARDLLLGRPVAIKVLRSEYTGDPSFLARFRAEATHAAALSHPNIAAVYDYGEVAGDREGEHLAYLVMELVEGQPLSTRLREEGPLSPEETLSVLRQTAVALAEAHHAGLVHRDVKPGNILLSTDEQVKITDFGIAWSAGSVPLTQAGQVLGTPQYLPPELAVGGSPSPASDVYSLGLVGYECLTGVPAFRGENPVTIALKQVNEAPDPLPADLPPGIRELVDVAVAKDPEERLPDGDAFVAAIDRVRSGRPLDEDPATTRAVPRVAVPGGPRRPAGGHPPVPDRGGFRRTLLSAVLALLVGVGVVAGLALTRGGTATLASTPQQQEQAIVLDDADYVGRPVDQVAVELAALGLIVDQQRQVVAGVAPGNVTQLDPAGRELHPGDAVTVFFAAAAPAAPLPDQGTPGQGAGDGAVTVAGVPAGAAGGGSAAGSGAGVDTPSGVAQVVPSAAAPAAGSARAPAGSATGTTAGTAPGTTGGSVAPTTGSARASSAAPSSSGSSAAPSSAARSSSAPSSSAPSSSAPSSSVSTSAAASSAPTSSADSSAPADSSSEPAAETSTPAG